jgi:hypothetical protein
MMRTVRDVRPQSYRDDAILARFAARCQRGDVMASGCTVFTFIGPRGNEIRMAMVMTDRIGTDDVAVLMPESRIEPFLRGETEEPGFEGYLISGDEFTPIEDPALLAELDARLADFAIGIMKSVSA